jgi:K+-sensing histidine kinase KdpD
MEKLAVSKPPVEVHNRPGKSGRPVGGQESDQALQIEFAPRRIPLAAQATIFDRFVRVEDRSSGPGTGLGPYLGRLLAEHQGGRLLLERSAPGEGSTFRLELAPAAEPAQ